MVVHHLSLGTNDVERARAFYDPVLAVLGLQCLSHEGPGYGAGATVLSLQRHRTALRHGGSDAGAPGLRPKCDPNYYGAFVLDPDGNKIEAVTFSSR